MILKQKWKKNQGVDQTNELNVGIESLKARHDVTKLDLTIHLLFLWCINIDLSI